MFWRDFQILLHNKVILFVRLKRLLICQNLNRINFLCLSSHLWPGMQILNNFHFGDIWVPLMSIILVIQCMKTLTAGHLVSSVCDSDILGPRWTTFESFWTNFAGFWMSSESFLDKLRCFDQFWTHFIDSGQVLSHSRKFWITFPLSHLQCYQSMINNINWAKRAWFQTHEFWSEVINRCIRLCHGARCR